MISLQDPCDIPIFVDADDLEPLEADDLQPVGGVAIIPASTFEPLPGGPALGAGVGRPGTRLPGRLLRPLGGAPALCRLIERVRQASAVGEVVVALSVAPEDDMLHGPARQAGAQVFRGSVHDLVGRLAGCVEWLGISDEHPVVRVPADAPLIDPRYLDAGLAALLQGHTGAVEFQEDQAEDLCAGLSAGFLRAGTIRLVDRRARTPVHRADVMSYVYEHPGETALRSVSLPEDLSYLRGGHRLLLQTAEDLALHEAIYLRLFNGAPIETAAAVAFLNADPVLASLNRGVLRKNLIFPVQSEVGWRAR